MQAGFSFCRRRAAGQEKYFPYASQQFTEADGILGKENPLTGGIALQSAT